MRLPELPGYQFDSLLGEDPFGWSFLATFHGSEKRVVRVLKSLATNDQLIYQSLKHFAEPDFELPGMAKIHDFAFQNKDTPTAYAMPFFGWDSSIKRVGENQVIEGSLAVPLVKALAKRLASIHKEDLFHGGLRPSNIFVTDDQSGDPDVCIAHFGEAFVAGSQYLDAGEQMFFLSPEQLSTGDYSGGKGMVWDIYSFGVIAYYLLTSKLPRLNDLHDQYLADPGPFDELPAITFGQLTVASAHFSKQLAKEAKISWPGADQADPSELALRPVIEKCLAYASAERYGSMAEVSREVAAALRGVVPSKEESVQVVEKVPLPKAAPEKGDEVAPTEVKETPVRSAGKKPEPKISVTEEKTVSPDTAATAKAPTQKISAISSLKTGDVPFWWKVAGAAAIIAFLPLLVGLLFSQWKLKSQGDSLVSKTKQHKESIEEQAADFDRMLDEKKKSEQVILSKLDEAEDSRSRLLGEAKLARQIVRATQDNGDVFFRLVLDNRDTDVLAFQEGRKQALIDGRRHYERLIEVYGDAPDFLGSTANALFYLAEIYKETGENDKAIEAYNEAERRYLAIQEQTGSRPPEQIDNLARGKRAMGEISMKKGRYASAMNYFGESSTWLGEFRRVEPKEAVDATVRMQVNLLSIAECERILNRSDVALDAAQSIGTQLLELQQEEPENDAILSALAKSFGLSGRILEGKGEGTKAIEAYQQASNLFGKAVKLNAAVDSYQLGLGNSLARVGLLQNDFKKLKAAADVLAGVIPENPFEPNYQKTLADVFGAMAKNQRDGGQRTNAIELEKRAVEILSPVIQQNISTPTDVKFSYGQRLAHLAELLGDSGKYDDSREPLKQAILIFSSIANSEYALPEYRSALARTQGLAGFACLNAGDKDGAKTHYELAQAEWKMYMQDNPNDTDAVRAAKWTQEQLAGLR